MLSGEDRDRGQFAGNPKHQDRPDDREAADQQRQRRRDETAEEEQREQEDDREGVQLRALQVRLDLVIDLLLGDSGSTDEHVVLVLEQGDDALACFLLPVVVGG